MKVLFLTSIQEAINNISPHFYLKAPPPPPPIRSLHLLIGSSQNIFCHPIYPSSESCLLLDSELTAHSKTCGITLDFLLYCVHRADPQMADSNTQDNQATRRIKTARKHFQQGHIPPHYILHQITE